MTGTPPSFAAHPDRGELQAGLLDEILRAVRIRGSVYMNARLSSPFGILAPKRFDEDTPMARLRHASIFHLVVSGGCSIRVDDGEARRLSAGDIVLIPFANRHVIWEGEADIVLANLLCRQSPVKGIWTITHGGNGTETRMVCGWIESAEFMLLPLFRALPPCLILNLGDDSVNALITRTVGEILALAEAMAAGTDLMLGRLMETLFIEVLRRYAAGLPAGTTGWFAALKDPVIARAMQKVHEQPRRRWTVDDMARESGTSRTVLAERFQQVMGRAPIEYVTSWRMQLAADRIRNTPDSLALIAADIGYESEASFNRAFKRVTGITPGRWRDGAAVDNAAGL